MHRLQRRIRRIFQKSDRRPTTLHSLLSQSLYRPMARTGILFRYPIQFSVLIPYIFQHNSCPICRFALLANAAANNSSDNGNLFASSSTHRSSRTFRSEEAKEIDDDNATVSTNNSQRSSLASISTNGSPIPSSPVSSSASIAA